MVTWEKVSPAVLSLANEIIYEHHPWLVEFRIGFVFRSEGFKKEGKLVIGNTSKVSPKFTPHLNLHFLIWLAANEWDRMTEIQRRALIDHELCHISREGKLVSHDIEEFGAILQRYGLWKSDLFRVGRVLQSAVQLAMPVHGNVKGEVVAVESESIAADMISKIVETAK